MNYTVTYLAYVTPVILTALVVILVIALRWFTHKERMGRIAQGMTSEEKGKAEKSPKIALATGLILSLIGLALTIGLVTLGVGPWLLAGLLPLSVGLGFILVSLVLAPAKPKKQKKQEPEEEPVTVEEVTAEPILESFRLDEEDEEDEEIEVI